MTSQNKNTIQNGKFIFRGFLAILIDLTILVFIILILNILIINIWMNTYASLVVDMNRIDNILMILSIFIIPCLYFVIGKIKYGATIGKKAINLCTIIKNNAKYKNYMVYNGNCNKENIIKICFVLLVLFIIIQIIPPKLYIEKVAENSEVYVFTKSKPMSDEKVFELIIEYDRNNPLKNTADDVGIRSFFPTQYETYSIMGRSPQILSDKQKRELLDHTHYTTMFDEVNTLIPVLVSYDYSKKMVEYHWTYKSEKYEAYFPLE